MTWTVLCDFDHTITTEDVTDTLLEKFALPEWHDIEILWEKGAIGSQECMRQQIALLRATPAQVDEAADSIHIDPHFKAFATLCQQHNVPLIITSDGLDYVIKHILEREGLNHLPVIASHLEHKERDRWELTTPYAKPACSSQASTCKCAMSRQMRNLTGSNKILYIGDGRSDFCVSIEEADLVLAKDSLLTYCQQQKISHQSFKTFAQASALLRTLIPQHDTILPTRPEEPIYA